MMPGRFSAFFAIFDKIRTNLQARIVEPTVVFGSNFVDCSSSIPERARKRQMSLDSKNWTVLKRANCVVKAIAFCWMIFAVFSCPWASVFAQTFTASETSRSFAKDADSKTVAKKNALDGDADRQLILIGVLARDSVADCAIRYKATADYLTSKIKGYRFAIVPIRVDDFTTKVISGNVDFTLCNPLLYTELQSLGEVSAIATMRDDFDGVYFAEFGGVIFCRSHRDDLKTIYDIRGKSFAAVSKNSFGGWFAGAEYLLGKGINPQEDSSNFAFLGTHSGVVRAVMDGIYDLGTVRTGTLEQMAKAGTINMNDFHIFHAIAPTDNFPFVSSTMLYPEWAFARTNSVSDSLAAKVSIALYEMPEDSVAAKRGHYAGWVVPASYRSVWECIQKVQGPLVWENGRDFYGYWDRIGLFFVSIVALVGGWIYIGSLKKKLRATETLNSQHTETVVMKDRTIRDLKRRISIIAGEEHEDMNVIRRDYRIEYVTPEWEAKYGPGVGQYCYNYFANRDEPCRHCGLREAVRTQRTSTVERSFTRESGRPFSVTTIPLVKDGEGAQLFGQTYCDVLTQNRKITYSVSSQERETRYLLVKGAIPQAAKGNGDAFGALLDLKRLIDDAAAPENLDINHLVHEVARMTVDHWQPVAEISFDLSLGSTMVHASELDVQMVIANLISNAVRCLERDLFSMKHKGSIVLSTRVQNDSVYLTVVDNGDGQNFIDQDELIADPERHENHREAFVKIGLSPTYTRVFEKWNGKIRVNCTNKNRTIRTVAIPMAKSDLLIPSIAGGSSVSQMYQMNNGKG